MNDRRRTKEISEPNQNNTELREAVSRAERDAEYTMRVYLRTDPDRLRMISGKPKKVIG